MHCGTQTIRSCRNLTKLSCGEIDGQLCQSPPLPDPWIETRPKQLRRMPIVEPSDQINFVGDAGLTKNGIHIVVDQPKRKRRVKELQDQSHRVTHVLRGVDLNQVLCSKSVVRGFETHVLTVNINNAQGVLRCRPQICLHVMHRQ